MSDQNRVSEAEEHDAGSVDPEDPVLEKIDDPQGGTTAQKRKAGRTGGKAAHH